MDLIVAACRVLANRHRLHLLQAVFTHPNSHVAALAANVGLPPDIASQQLKLLGSFHFIHARPKGRYVLHQTARPDDVSSPFLRDVLALLQRALAHKALTPCGAWQTESQQKRDYELIRTFTTYTHLRRLVILRNLAARTNCTALELGQLVHMSPAATRRHLEKLKRRGVVRSDGETTDSWRLEHQMEGVLPRDMLRIILRALQVPARV